MTIAECKQSNVLPELGTSVRTVVDRSVKAESFFVKEKHLVARQNGIGEYRGFVPGAGGEVWWVLHPDGLIGAYLYTEVFDR